LNEVIKQPIRNELGKFVKGASGNPNGSLPKCNIEKTAEQVKILAARATPELMKEMIQIALDKDTPKQTKLLYIKEIMDRGIGKIPKAIEVKDTTTANPMNILASMGQMFLNKMNTIEGEVIAEAKALPEPVDPEDELCEVDTNEHENEQAQ